MSRREGRHSLARMARSPQLRALLFPRRVAVVGAGQKGLGRLALDHIVAGGFRGELVAVHPEAERVGDVPAVSSVARLGAPPDLALVVLPRDGAVAAVTELALAGCGAAIVVTAGFSETGGRGREAETAMVAAARAAGMRLLGPNCFGLVHTHPRARLHASFGVGPAPVGSLAFVSQSGAVGDYALYHAAAHGLGFSLVASVGNEADVTLGELVRFAAADERTRAVACYVEEPAAPAELLETLAVAARVKPVVLLKGARSNAGAGAAASHTGRLALGGGEAVEALLRATGAVLVRTLEELLLVSATLLRSPAGAGRRVAVLTNAGGPAVLAVDAAAAAGLEPVRPRGRARARLGRLLPGGPPSGPVVDLTASGTAEVFGAAARALAGGADALLPVVMSPEGTDPTPVVAALATAWPGPLALALLARGPAVDRARELAARLGLPCTAEPATAARALSALARRAEAPPRVRWAPLPAPARRAAEAVLRGGREGPLRLADALGLAAACGVPVAPFAVAADAAEAARAAAELGLPVFLKVDAEGLVHRTEARAVAGPCRSAEAVAKEARRLCRGAAFRRGGASSRLVVQASLSGVELLVGCVRAGAWGLVGLVGRGGVGAEAERDVAYVAPPFGAEQAAAALGQTRAALLLGPYRGGPAADLDAAAHAAAAVGRLAAAYPAIAEIELSPFVAARGGAPSGAVDVRVVVGSAAHAAAEAEGALGHGGRGSDRGAPGVLVGRAV